MTIEQEIRKARATRDPLKRAVAIQDCYKRALDIALTLADERGQHILDAHRDHHSYGTIADAMGVSKPRVQQLIRPKKSRAKPAVNGRTRARRAA
jgi:hypothetical protein